MLKKGQDGKEPGMNKTEPKEFAKLKIAIVHDWLVTYAGADRVVDQLEERYPGFNGLNLSWETREGIIKHKSPYDTPAEILVDLMPGTVPTIEAQIIKLPAGQFFKIAHHVIA